MRRLFCCGLLLFLVITSVSCTLVVPEDTGLLSGTPCAPPCWQNLTPGVSTVADVEQFVGELRLDEQKTLGVHTGPDGRKAFTWERALMGIRAIEVVEERVVLIGTRPPGFDLRLGTVVDHFGPPESLYAIHGCYGHGGCYLLELYYPQLGLAFESWPGVENLGELKPDMTVSAVYYFEPGDLTNYFVKGKGWTPDDVARHMRYVQPWPGFGQFPVPTEIP